uniref:NADH dehydrogenase subunit 6 n=1 Tax=Griffithsia okiensis TaxID=291168 RepID=UPI002E79C71A|nr:NADH dehydrogenase subunit 6 [Griffithsia okiensis]WQF69535.1 NADH dehydrogenase subunit 6 [Griffithsia okiensis]
MDSLLFFIFSSFALLSSIMVISLTNPIHSVLFLILTFCNITFLLLLLGAEFFSFLIIIVYVGAIAVLFLFVIMMLNIKNLDKEINFLFVIPIILLMIFFNINYFFDISQNVNLLIFPNNFTLHWIYWIEENYNKNNIIIIGNSLYTYFSSLFILSGLILLVAMVGVIVLTMHQKTNLKYQKIEFQLIRNFKNSIKFIKLK